MKLLKHHAPLMNGQLTEYPIANTLQRASQSLWGPVVKPDGVLYRLPKSTPEPPQVRITTRTDSTRMIPMKDSGIEGLWTAWDEEGKPGDRYVLVLPDGRAVPDPASRFQPEGVHQASEVMDSSEFPWTDQGWHRPDFRDLVIYELHVGTFTREGTFRSAIEKLAYLKEMHVNAIELMPVAAFPGERNWGYDGVYPFAPSEVYGTPDGLRALVDAAHAAGIAVILDVVYNHFGPDGNYVTAACPSFTNPRHMTPWGEGMHFDGEGCAPVRSYFLENVRYWLEEFHLDGLRLDATHTIADDSPRHILADIVEVIHDLGCYAIAEEPRNLARFTESAEDGGHGFDAVWSDEFHHVTRVGQTGEAMTFYGDFTGTLAEACETMQNGWLYRGRYSAHAKCMRGTECAHLPPSAFIHFISTHDHAGNHALGKRLNHSITPEAYRALSLLLCLTPYTPMLFMGQEWAATTPFLFFCDHNSELGELVSKGRREEFAGCPGFEDENDLAKIPDPQCARTMQDSRLYWDELKEPDCNAVAELYESALDLRMNHPCFRPKGRTGWSVVEMDMGCLAVRYDDADGAFLLVVNLWGSSGGFLTSEPVAALRPEMRWTMLLSSNSEASHQGTQKVFDSETMVLTFDRPEAILLREAPPEQI